MTSARPPIPSAESRGRGLASELFGLDQGFQLRSLLGWPVLLFLVLICVPPIALVILGADPTASTFDHVAWIFAAYFSIAWLLLLGIIIRPEQVTRAMLVLVTVVALVVEVPLAITLEADLHAANTGLGQSIFTIGLPEELAKAIPVLVVVLVYRRRSLTPRDYLFLGAVSGLAFGASEVVHYFTVNGVEQFYLTIKSAVPEIERLLATGHDAPTALFSVLIEPVRYFTLDFVWRFLTDPISHACWSGLTGYFIGLAVTRRHKWYATAWIGLAAAMILHGLNDWGRVNGRPLWIVVVAVSGILLLVLAKSGSNAKDGSSAQAAAHRAPGPAADDLPLFLHVHETPEGAQPEGATPASASPAPWWHH